MSADTNLYLTAWYGEERMSIARSMTDFNYAFYLSDLAVQAQYQGQDIGDGSNTGR